jgi:hypothetical protein
MTYSTRVTEDITVTYAGNTVSIRFNNHDTYWGREPEQCVDVPIDKLNMLILALQDIAKIKRNEW